MRIRVPIAVAFVLSCIGAAYLGLTQTSPLPGNRDKLAHVAVFFIVTLLFYWSIDAPRKRVANVTILVCCLIASVGSEFAQHFLTHAQRQFDPQDIAANLVGSIFATLLSSLYHARLNSRRRQQRYERLRADLEANPTEEQAAEVELAEIQPEP